MKMQKRKRNSEVIELGSDQHLAKTEYESEQFIRKVMEGKAYWGEWHYDHENKCLEIDPITGIGNKRWKAPYSIDIEELDSSEAIMGWLLHLSGKRWCGPETLGNFFRAVYELAGRHEAAYLLRSSKRIDIEKRLESLTRKDDKKYMKVQEVAELLRISKASVYRMVKDGKLNAIKLPLRKEGELRILRREIDRLLTS